MLRTRSALLVMGALALTACIFPNECMAVIEKKAAIPKSREEVAKMKVKKLRQFLREREVECKACRSKDEFIDKVMESLDLPVVAAPINTVGESSDYEDVEIFPSRKGNQSIVMGTTMSVRST